MLKASYNLANRVYRSTYGGGFFNRHFFIAVHANTDKEAKTLASIADAINDLFWAKCDTPYSVNVNCGGRGHRNDLVVMITPKHYNMDKKTSSFYQASLAVCDILASYGVKVEKR